MKLRKKTLIFFRCDGKSECLVKSSNEYAGNDPCYGTYKYTDVSFTCMEPQKISNGSIEVLFCVKYLWLELVKENY
jgi:hypothetical protein